jgi:hypothetical protein
MLNMEMNLQKYKYMIEYEGSERNPIFLFGVEVGPGWIPIIETLLDILMGLDINKKLRLFQIKEKFGQFRFYYDYVGDDKNEKIMLQNQINLYTDKINNTCELCGKPGTTRLVKNWYRTCCDECLKNKG